MVAHLPTQSSVAKRFQPFLENMEHAILGEIAKLLAEALEIGERVFVDEAHETKQLQQRILERRCRQEQFLLLRERLLQRIGDDIGWLVDVPKLMGLIDNY